MAGQAFNILNPFTWHRTGAVREAVQSGDPNVDFSDSPTGSVLRNISEKQRLLREMGY
jgi:hypothetical protein